LGCRAGSRHIWCEEETLRGKTQRTYREDTPGRTSARSGVKASTLTRQPHEATHPHRRPAHLEDFRHPGHTPAPHGLHRHITTTPYPSHLSLIPILSTLRPPVKMFINTTGPRPVWHDGHNNQVPVSSTHPHLFENFQQRTRRLVLQFHHRQILERLRRQHGQRVIEEMDTDLENHVELKQEPKDVDMLGSNTERKNMGSLVSHAFTSLLRFFPCQCSAA
jgi:hypothetical protein